MFTLSTLTITPEILGLISQIDEFKGAWRSMGSLAPDRLLALRRIATIESVGSSKQDHRAVKRITNPIDISLPA